MTLPLEAVIAQTVPALADVPPELLRSVLQEIAMSGPAWVGPAAPTPADIRARNDAREQEELAEAAEAARLGKDPPRATRPDSTVLLPLAEYDHIVVGFSGGKDSLACLLHLLEILPPEHYPKIELQHHAVDGEPGVAERVFDWPCTEHYCARVAQALNLPLYFSWREGGILREMQRVDEYRQGVAFQTPDADGNVTLRRVAATEQGKRVTRRLLDEHGKPAGSPAWPQQSGDLNVRWCSATAKIEVARTVFAHDPRFKQNAKILLVTGERREESAGRSKYAYAEKHATNAQARNRRRVDQVRLILDWTTAEVWGIIQRWGVIPHPCYWLGFGRASCETCIFNGREEWATLADIHPSRFQRIVGLETWAGATIDRERGVLERVQGGYAVLRGRGKAKTWETLGPASSLVPGGLLQRTHWVEQALSEHPDMIIRVPSNEWVLPPGAFRKGAGPT